MAASLLPAFVEALRDLRSIEGVKIRLLANIAKENPWQAPDLVKALESHLLHCSTDQKLPALYVLDCILKSETEPYPDLLDKVVQKVFGPLWDQATPDLRTRIAKTAGTWRDFVQDSTMTAVLAKMQPPAAATMPAGWPQQSLLFPGAAAPMLPTAPQIMLSATGQPILLSTLPGTMLAAPHLAPGPAAFGGVLLPGAPAPFIPAAPQPLPIAPSGQLQQVLNAATAAVMGSTLASTMMGLGAQLQGSQASSSAAAAAQPGRSPMRAGNETPQDPVKSAVDALFKATATTKSKFLDLQFVRNRRLQTATHQVRHWYVSVDQWLEGTRAAQDVPSHFFEEEQGDAANEQGGSGAAQVCQVEEDPSQPTCAISGEAFERTYDPDTDKWYYEDAVVLTGEQAAAYGVMDGSIVKVHCIAGGPPTVAKAVVVEAAPDHAHKSKGTAAAEAAAGQTVGAKRPLADVQAGGGLSAAAQCAPEAHVPQAPEAKRIKA